MKLNVPRQIVAPAIFVLVAVLLLLSEYFYGPDQVRMVNVGGNMNECTCSQRLEK